MTSLADQDTSKLEETSTECRISDDKTSEDICNELAKLQFDPRKRLKSWLGKILTIEITDKRLIQGCFVCTDRDCNVILENSWEFTRDNKESRFLGLVMVPGEHIISMSVETSNCK